jgi:glycosyltransferase involved in cell wall biosynthesis
VNGGTRVCVIRCHHYPRDTRVAREVAALLDAGHSVDVICLRDRGEPRREHSPGLVVRRLPIRHRAGAGAVRLLSEYLAFFVIAAWVVTALHARRRFAVVQVNSVPDVLVFAALGPRLMGARVILDLQEPMPEFFATRFRTGPRHPVVRLLGTLEQASIRFADAAITVTEQVRQTLIGRGAAAEKVTVVMDGADERVFDPARTVVDERDPGRFVLVSHGSIEPQYGLDTAIHALALVGDRIPGLQLRFYGDGSARDELRRLARELGVDGQVWFSDGFVPVDALVTALARADAGLVAMKSDAFRDLTLASKMFDFIAMRKPMVVARTRSVMETFGEDCFVGFRSGEPDDLARAVLALHGDPAAAARCAERAARVAEPLRWAAQRRRYLETVDALLQR